MAKRKEHHEDHPDERWLLSYADMVTLLFCLFLVLFSISVVNTTKFELLKQTLHSAFSSGLVDGGASVLPQTQEKRPAPVADLAPGINPDFMPPTSVSLVDSQPGQALETKQLQSARERVERAARRAGLGSRIEASVDERGLAIRLLTDGVLFDSGRAVLRGEAGRLLAPIAESVRELGNPVRVEGHTDSRPIATAEFPSNYELSSARALSVVHYLLDHGVPGRRLQGVALGEFRPRADNATDAGRAENRRIEVIVLRVNGAPRTSPADALGG